MKLRISLFVVFFILTVACTKFDTENTQSDEVDWARMIPADVEEFHRTEYFGGWYGVPLMIITAYSIPYQNSFQVVYLSEDNWLSGWHEVPNHAHQGRWQSKVTDPEIDSILNNLNTVRAHWPGPWVAKSTEPEYVLWLSYITLDGYELTSCSSNDCPQELCTLFDSTQSLGSRNPISELGVSCSAP